MRRVLQWLVIPMVVVVAACGGSSGTAATFNQTTISNESFARELNALKNNKQLAEVASQKGYSVATNGTIDPRVAAQWLAADLEQIPVDQEVARRKLVISDDALAKAKANAAQQLGGLAVLEAFPKWFQELLVGRQARVEALIDAFTAEDGFADDAAWLAANPSALAEYCPSGNVVRHILVKTREEAQSINDALATGGSFEQLAIERSTDPGSRAEGGYLGCVETGKFVAPFEQTMLALAPGQTSGPVQSEFGFHVIRVDPVSVGNAPKAVRALRQRAAGQKFSTWLDEQISGAAITVAPRWGTLSTVGGLTITPPTTTSTTATPGSTTSGSGASTPSSAPLPTTSAR